MRRLLALGAVMALLVVACGDDDTTAATTTTTPPPPPGEHPVCSPLRAVHDLDQEFGSVLEDSVDPTTDTASPDVFAEFRETAQGLEPLLPTLTARYDEAIGVAPSELVADLTTVRDGTVVLWDVVFGAIDDSDTIDDFTTRLQALFQDEAVVDEITGAAGATLALDEFTLPECGFALSE